MFCPKCGKRNEGEYKFCRGCGQNLSRLSNAMERRWRKRLNRSLDDYIRHRNRNLPKRARQFRRSGWLWLIALTLFLSLSLSDGERDWWVDTLWILPILVVGLWDYVSYRRISSSGSTNKKLALRPAIPPDSAMLSSLSAPTTNELESPLNFTESTTRRLEDPLDAKKPSGDDLL